MLILELVLAASAQERRPITIDDLTNFDRVSDPEISPDAMTVVYVVDRYDKTTGGRTSDLWLVPLTGEPSASLRTSEARQLTRSGKHDSSPRWSPDGTRIAFLSDRDSRSQIWIIAFAGGEANKLVSLPVDVGGLVWLPDAKRLAFTAEIYPDCPAAEVLACTAKRDKENEKNKVKARVYDKLMYRHSGAWQEGKRSHVFVIAADGSSTVRDLTPGDFDVPPFLGGRNEYAFSPDSQEFCFARNTNRDRALSTNSDLWTVSLSSGSLTAPRTSEPKKITTNPAWDGSPRYSPDGRYIAFRAQARAGFEADRFRLMLYERATDLIVPLSQDFDDRIEDFVWSPDSHAIYFTSFAKAQSPIFTVSVPDGRVRELIGATYNTELQLSHDGQTLVFIRESLSEPSEVWRASVAGGQAQPLTQMNKAASSRIQWGATEEVYYEGAGGTLVHGWVVKPPGFDPQKKYPGVVLIHGGPQWAWGNYFSYTWNAQMFAAPEYIVFLPNPRGSIGWGQKLVDEISGDWGGKAYEDIMKGVDYFSRFAYVDAERICAAGPSFGGYMVNWIAGHTERFRCLVSHAGIFNLVSMYGSTDELWFPEWDLRGTPWTNPEAYAKWSPHTYVRNFRTPTLVSHGEFDYRVPLTEGLQMFTSLQRQKVSSKLLYFPDEGHAILKPQNSVLFYKTVHEWLATYLK